MPPTSTRPGWHVRIGLHQGPVVAGIMGKRSFVFDLWGDTVNVAARVAAEAEPDAVVVTGAMWPFFEQGLPGARARPRRPQGQGKDRAGALSGTQVAARPSTRIVSLCVTANAAAVLPSEGKLIRCGIFSAVLPGTSA